VEANFTSGVSQAPKLRNGPTRLAHLMKKCAPMKYVEISSWRAAGVPRNTSLGAVSDRARRAV
jgi:hypothetical protein